jgi:hypothetical protein
MREGARLASPEGTKLYERLVRKYCRQTSCIPILRSNVGATARFV